jgi:tetratricopeptide (TPR) repeat protein
MNRKVYLALPLALAVLGAAPRLAVADATPPAVQRFEKGKTAFRLGDYDGAIREWTEAYKLKNDPVFLYNIAQAYREKKDFEKAISFYKSYVKEAPDAPNRATVEARIQEMKDSIDKQQATAEKPPSGPLGPGERPPLVPSERTEPNRHTPGERTPTDVSRRPGRSLEIAGIAIGVGGAALLVTGIVFGLSAKSDQSDVQNAVDSHAAWSADLDSQASSGQTKAAIANISIGIGVAALVGGGVLYYLGARRDRAMEVSPTASRHGVGATLTVRY